MSRVLSNGLGVWVSFTGQVIPRTQKMVLDSTLLNNQHYMLRIKGKVDQSRNFRPPLHLSEVAIEKGTFGSPLIKVANFTLLPVKNKI